MNPAVAYLAQRSRSPIAGLDLLLILLFAALVRLALYNGAFGSDDLVYFERAAQLARGEWTSANYNGALRYGFNLPAGGLIALFGESVFVANLWPLVCSLIEIGAAFAFANAAMNRRAGVFAAMLLATAPLHIAVATRIHADPVVSMFVTVAFALLYFGTSRNRPWLLFAAGLSTGGVFWAKELAAVTWFAFLPMLWFFRGQSRNCVYFLVGGIVMMMLHGVLMVALTGDPFHLATVVLGALKRNFIDGAQGEDGATYYLRYLFLDLRHTGALAFFAVAALVWVPQWLNQKGQSRVGFSFLVVWWFGLLLVLSVFPVSLSPLRFTMKQSNYITLFLAPTALMAGMAMAALPRSVGQAALAICIALGLFLGALQQADYRVFTANTKALADFAVQHPHDVIVGSTNNSALGNLWGRLLHPTTPKAAIVAFRDLTDTANGTSQLMSGANEIFAVIDKQTLNWFAGNAPIAQPLPCWQHELTLEPSDLSWGNRLAATASVALAPLKLLAVSLNRLAKPERADVYRITGRDLMCGTH